MPYSTGETRRPLGFWSLILTQFQGAFNDNAFKFIILLTALNSAHTLDAKNTWNSIISAIFMVPFLLFSMHGGYLADRFSKQRVIFMVKIAEIFFMISGVLAYLTGNLWLCVGIIFLLSTQAAYFGPSKYGIIPELVPEKRISWANGILEMTTFLAIILGIYAGTLAIQKLPHAIPVALSVLAVFSVIGTISSMFITKVPAADPAKKYRLNMMIDIVHNIKLARKDTLLWMAVLGNTYFWFIGALLLANIPIFGQECLHLSELQLGIMTVALAGGIGIGSYAAGHLSGNKIEYGLIPLGAIMMTVFSADLFFFAHTYHHAVATLAILGFGAGFFAVPINALIQHRPAVETKGGILGMSYFLSNVASFGAAGVFYALTKFIGLKPDQVFLAASIMTLAATSYYLYRLPDSLIRLVLWFITHTFYRIKVVGRDNIPEKGGALFVTNHMSFADGLFLIASTDRFVRFIMYTRIYNLPALHPFVKILKAIPIAAEDGAREMLQSIRKASEAIQEGDVVCIFAEGQITRIGQMLPFRRGFERIMKGVDAPIIPIHLDRVWGSLFSFEKGKILWKMPRRIPYPITVTFGRPLPGNTPVSQVRQVVQELSTEAFYQRRKDMLPLHQAFFKEARRHKFKVVMEEEAHPRVTNLQAMATSVVLARKLKKIWAKEEEMTGLLVPPSVAATCLNMASYLCGKAPVNLNYTASQEAFDSSLEQCKIKTLISSRALAEKIKIKLPENTLYLEDMAKTITGWDKFSSLLMGGWMPMRWLERSLGCKKKWNLDDMATVIFSSGSTGDPKGVMLSHYNIYSDFEGAAQVIAVDRNDKLLGMLPFFHSFGFTAALCFPLIKGFHVVYHPNPLDLRAIGNMVERFGVTLMISTPTFLQAYIKRIPPGQFGSLRFVLTGAEKLPTRVADTFEERFGIRPYEAYGCTECSPAVTINTQSYRAAGFFQVGGKQGSIGHPLPGVSVKIVNPETMQPLPLGQAGLLLVKGPNVMMGYLGRPDLTAKVMHEGWYITGDIAALDEDGFLAITDRLSRFSKIGGEMIPHIKIEEALHAAAELTTQSFAVTAVPDEAKGERIIVLHTLSEEKLKETLAKLPYTGLPNLWTPRPDSYYHLEALPVLGTGKLDLRQIKEIARNLSEKSGLSPLSEEFSPEKDE